MVISLSKAGRKTVKGSGLLALNVPLIWTPHCSLGALPLETQLSYFHDK